MRFPYPRGTLVFRVNRLPEQDPTHQLVSARQLEALCALLAVYNDGEVR